MRKSKTNQGITISELVIFIVIAGIAYLALMRVFIFANELSMKNEVQTTMIQLLLDRLEIVKSKRFDEKLYPSWSTTLGPDTGELAEADFDDCDDYQHYLETNIPGHEGYQRYTRVFYVNPAISINDSIPNVMFMKKIIVRVSHPDYGNLDMSSLIASRSGL
ncbi:MAG: hypothetical protein K9N11_06605 [Lentisphaeria bacterium]|nr:hypothetical protein [Candidatus Neomarinimicrobiota bacterium]MCF7842505.1 hypothetical protein [Lentisphaeria bacterium]